MSDIRKRVGSKSTTYQVRYPSKKTKSGYAFSTFNTLKEARAFVESGKTGKAKNTRYSEIQTVEQAIDKWLQICEKEGLNGRDPVTQYTLKNYVYFAGIMKNYAWNRELDTLVSTDIVEFRSWLLLNYSRYLSRKTLSLFQTVIKEMAIRGYIASNVAAVSDVNAYWTQ